MSLMPFGPPNSQVSSLHFQISRMTSPAANEPIEKIEALHAEERKAQEKGEQRPRGMRLPAWPIGTGTPSCLDMSAEP